MKSTITIGLGGLILGVLIGMIAAPAFTGRNIMMNPSSMMGGSIDRHFIEQMIPHHEGAVAMAELALERSTRPEIISFAEGIVEAQTQEINDMTAWYTEWFGRAPSGAGHSMMRMEGMEGDLDELETAPNFDREFLSQMIVHHEMAIMMAQMLEAGTERPEMQQLAKNIIASQTQEINIMRGWLAE